MCASASLCPPPCVYECVCVYLSVCTCLCACVYPVPVVFPPFALAQYLIVYLLSAVPPCHYAVPPRG